MSVIRALFSRRTPEETALPGDHSTDRLRDGSVAAPGGQLLDILSRMPQWSYVMDQAAEAFERGDWNAGILNLSHAAYLGATREETVAKQDAIQRMRRVTKAACRPTGPEAA